ncbi:antibiotic biosynthesis monooxygenase [Pseudomonas sp. DTU_2021_1001937_2_SI_NGA_ILE_001]|uniref:antibiotic biosynthesis monooxygenase n=1 Tax=Pseudomonas sp. DTU_2021_1001937_2_SI_NGA_ILE_001 TaxID=3077589 RepID=UPI0025FED781|nr:antibiotic biosynthesis monooxygenase [Pseudomonas sp. DTU_2021_1001937_2_SI_NGA_ILE_001]WNW10543.1 antibiotic biosynthesis monooxygenase [Pseudomonas sp. DTU_2021_1001937_2_SI_NGA_ILE_001]
MPDTSRLDAKASEPSVEVVTLVIRHRIKAGHESHYEQWLKRIVAIASQTPGHLGVDVMRGRNGGLQAFTSVLRFASTEAMQQWLDSDQRRELVREAAPMLADGDQTQVAPHSEFWFNPGFDEQPPPPRWKQAVVSYLVILPLSLLVPLLWQPVLALRPWLSSYFMSNVLITLTIVLLVVYLMMPAATRLCAGWLNASANDRKSTHE